MTLCWLQTISSLQTVIMAGFIFYHPKLGEKRNKLLEEAFKLEVIFSFLNHQLVLKRSGSERWWEDFCGWNTDSVWGKKKIFPCFLKRNFPITIVFFCASKCDHFSISMHSVSNNWTFLSNNGWNSFYCYIIYDIFHTENYKNKHNCWIILWPTTSLNIVSCLRTRYRF